MKKALLSLFFMVLILSESKSQSTDARASQIADSVITAMGGMNAFNNAHYLQWTFFGRRNLTWDKWTGNCRIEMPARKMVILVNLNSKKGKVFRNGNEITQPDSVDFFMNRGYQIWVNDSYWLIMPFKLKDPGVNLQYMGMRSDSTNKNCYVLKLTFNNVGVTPENKYMVFVDPKTYMVTQWQYFAKASEDTPDISTPWKNYQWYNHIQLSGDRGGQGQLGGIAVLDSMPPDWFTKP